MNEKTRETIVRVLKNKFTIIGALLLVFYTLAGFFLAPYLIGHFLPKTLSERFQAEVSLEQVKINPYSLTVDARDFRISEPSGSSIVGFDHLHVNFQLSSIFRWALTFRDVILDGLFLCIVIDSEGNLNLERLAGPETAAEKPKPAKERKRPPRILLHNIEINEANIEFTDARQTVPAKVAFHPLTIHLDDISTLQEREGDYSLTATGADGAMVQWSGRVALHPIRSEGKLAFSHVPLETPWNFIRSMVDMFPPDGEMSLETRYLVDLGKDDTVAALNDLSFRIMDMGLRVKGAEEAYLNVPELALDVEKVDMVHLSMEGIGLALHGIAAGFSSEARPVLEVGRMEASGGAFDLGKRSAALELFELDEGLVDAILDRRGGINLLRFMDTVVSAGNIAEAGKTDKEEVSAEDSEAWSIFLDNFYLKEFTARLTDERVRPGKPLIVLENIAFSLSGFDGNSPVPFNAALRVAQGGTVTASGALDPSSTSVKCDIAVEKLSLPVIQPYLAQAAKLNMKSGLLTTAGSFSLTGEGEAAYRGRVEINGLEVIENSTRDVLLGWNRLRTPEMRLTLDPDGLVMENLTLAGLKAKLIISDDGKVNVVEAFKSDDDASGKSRPDQKLPDTAGDVFPVRIGRVNIDRGLLHFADFSLMPQFDTMIHELKGVITGVSSSPGARTRVDLDGRVDRYGSSKIKGEINFFDPKEFTDISMIFDNMEMTSMTPYSGKFAGREIDDGRLSLDLQYRIEDSSLLGNNKVVIDSLKLGKRVESPDAVSLPLDLAIALLRDANGIINIGLPITGSLDDPQFSIGPIVWQAIFNLLSRIVTSPFRALGALLGGDEETLNMVVFEPGSFDIPLLEQEKLDKLLVALNQRPQLKLIVTGRYEAIADGKALRDRQVRMAFAEESGIELEPGEDPGPIDFGYRRDQRRLSSLFVKRYGREAYRQALADLDEAFMADENRDPKKRKPDPEERA
ncbi:MAG: DUF748 domain-containing protein, partial [Syntrophales bacterium]|nr:DUF748 domain-containing protein [Syntrophales bacterium]